MLDINQAIRNLQRYALDPEGHMTDLPPWSPQQANHAAAREGLELSEAHWEIIYYLRERYRDHGNIDHARDLLHELQMRFCEGHGRGHLYDLFPGGPVTQASRLAGLPTPPHAQDLSFGSVM
ncbi:MAG: TusE/DsrC/DsvC family sulfur relay protein [Pseudomonadota bacterium]